MNTDDGFVVDYEEVLWPEKKVQVYKLFEDTEKASIEAFLIAAQGPVSIYYAHLKSHSTIPDSREQERKLKKLRKKTTQLNELTDEVIGLLNDAPFQLRRRASEAKIPIHSVQNQLVTMLQVINDVTTHKSKYRPELELAIRSIATLFEEHIGIKPIVCAFKTKADIPTKAPSAERFVPILVELLNLSADYASRRAREFLSS